MTTQSFTPHPVITQEPALWCRRGTPPRMESMHRHNDIELNVVLSGQLRYLISGRQLVVPAGHIAMFWAAQPHGLVGSCPGDVCWVHVPLSTALSWNLPHQEFAELARMEPLVIEAGALGRRLEQMVSTWLEEYRDPEQAEIALLETQAMIRRVVRSGAATAGHAGQGAAEQEHADRGPTGHSSRHGLAGAADEPAPSEPAPSEPAPSPRARHVMEMAEFVVASFREELTVGEIAAAVHLTPSHAMTVFRRAVGVTLGDYVTMCRVAEAQRLLLTTSMTSAQIAASSGFGSLSSYYAHVTAACGMPPREYRRLAA
ncbi:helix-turn-helix domain-containing protein [Brachybacterium sp. GCM10030268]|uniref:helix-turn-helix domain-containing protein n=1 Tax=Brachybacterium sp. GCM10030268 TaxID=3273382 RepID=UPI003609B31B